MRLWSVVPGRRTVEVGVEEVWAVFEDRNDAGRQLAPLLDHYRGADAVALGLPRGGVPVAAVVARTLHVPLDVIVVRKLGVPFEPEVAMGAIAEGEVRVRDRRPSVPSPRSIGTSRRSRTERSATCWADRPTRRCERR